MIGCMVGGKHICKALYVYNAILQNAYRAVVSFYRKRFGLACLQIADDFLIRLVF